MDAMICQDCALTHTNGEPFDGEDGREPSGYWVVYLDDADQAESFHVPATPCPSCGTTLAGTWFRATDHSN